MSVHAALGHTEAMTDPSPSAPSVTPVISASAVQKSWGDNVVFSNLTADVLKGVTGLLGSNGSGKTTFLGMLLGLHQPNAGSISVLGADPAHAGPELRELIGYSPEHHDLPADVAAQDLVRHVAQIHGLPRREATTRSSDALWLVANPVPVSLKHCPKPVLNALSTSHSPTIKQRSSPRIAL